MLESSRFSIGMKYRFELLLPLADNEGVYFLAEYFEVVMLDLRQQFGGFRFQPLSPYEDEWEEGAQAFRDRLLLFTTDAPRTDESLTWFVHYKEQLKGKFRQVEIYLAVTEVWWL